MSSAKAIREMQERTRKEREVRREREEAARAAVKWEEEREERERREAKQRQRAWAETAQAVEVCQEEDAVKRLKSLGASAAALVSSEVDGDGATLLHLAVSRCLFEVIEAILSLDRRAVGYADAKGQTALHRAAAIDSSGELIETLAEYAGLAGFDRRDGQGRTPLDVARHWALPEAARAIVEAKEALLSGPSAEAEVAAAAEELGRAPSRGGSEGRRGPASSEASSSSRAPASSASAAGGGSAESLVHLAGLEALKAGRYDEALALIKERTWVFVNVKDDGQRTLLHLAAARGRAELCEALMEREDFLAEGLDKEQATALHIAAAGEKSDCCRAIVTAGDGRFDGVNAMDLRRRTALHLAALRGDEESYRAIASHPDCNPHLPDFDGRTAPEYALERGIDVELPSTAVGEVEF